MDPVIIAGAGPVGLTLALALARADVPSVVLDEGPGAGEPRPARTAVLRADTADLVERLAGTKLAAARWTGLRFQRRKQELRQHLFEPYDAGGPGLAGPHPADEAGPGATGASPAHLAQHDLTAVLRAALAEEDLVKVAVNSRLDTVEQDANGVTVHTRGPNGTWWRGSYLVGCDGPRSTVRKLLGIRFPGRTAVERYAVAALRTELPWPGEAVLHRLPPWPGAAAEVTARPLPDEVWRLDWLLPARSELVTPQALVALVRDTLAGWCGTTPPYELIDTGVHTVHHRLARTWRSGRCFLAGDAAHLLGALGTQGVDEGLRDADNLAWKLALCWHHGAPADPAGGFTGPLLDSYQDERRTAVAARLRAADQALPVLRGGGGLRAYVPGAARGHDTLLTDGHLGRGPLGAPASHSGSPLTVAGPAHAVPVGTAPGALAADVPVTAPDGAAVRLRDRLGRGRFLVVLVAPGTRVWDRRHWLTAGVMPRLAAAVTALPARGELLVTEAYPGASAHTVLLVRPDGHLVTAFAGVHPAELYAATDEARGGAPDQPESPAGRGKAGKIGRAGKSGKAGKAGKSGKAGEIGKPGRAAYPENAGPPEQGGPPSHEELQEVRVAEQPQGSAKDRAGRERGGQDLAGQGRAGRDQAGRDQAGRDWDQDQEVQAADRS